jgi:triphosphoribosyl-dephospho-CoA synthase
MEGSVAFLRACALDVAVRKPGNVSRASSGHGMQAEQFIASATAAAPSLFATGTRIGQRIEGAVRATQAAVGCNTNLGILLLCAPLAAAAEAGQATSLRAAIEAQLAALDLADAAAAFGAIALANPGGLGAAAEQDVNHAPTLDLRAAMALAADRDRIALQYRDGFAELFEVGLATLPQGFSLGEGAPDSATTAVVQRLYLAWLASAPDTHIVRKHGPAVAQIVMTAAQDWARRADAGARLDAHPDFVAWDLDLKAHGVNPGTSADLTVATLLLSALGAAWWHGS